MTEVRRPRSCFPRLRLLGIDVVVLLVGGGTVALLGTTFRHAWAAVQAPGPTRPADALLGCVAAAGTLLVAWVTLSLTLSLLAALPGTAGAVAARGAATLAPATVRRLAAALLGASLGATLSAGTAVPTMAAPTTASAAVTAKAGPETGDPVGGVPSAAWPRTPAGGGAHASTGAGASAGPVHRTDTDTTDGTSDGTGAAAPDAAWTPSPPDRTPVPDPDALHLLSPAPDARPPGRRGSRGRAAATRCGASPPAHLVPSATADEIAREWPRWHEANRRRHRRRPRPDPARAGPAPARNHDGDTMTSRPRPPTSTAAAPLRARPIPDPSPPVLIAAAPDPAPDGHVRPGHPGVQPRRRSRTSSSGPSPPRPATCPTRRPGWRTSPRPWSRSCRARALHLR